MPSDAAQLTVERPASPPSLDAPTAPGRPVRLLLRFIALGYLAAVLLVPVGAVIWRAFGDGIAPVWQAVTTPDALHAFWDAATIPRPWPPCGSPSPSRCWWRRATQGWAR